MARLSTTRSPLACLISAAFLWAVGTVISKALLASVSPLTYLFIQLAPSVCVMWTIVCLTGGPSSGWRAILPVALLGWLNPGLSYTFSTLGLAQSTASVTTLLWAAEPVFIVVLAWFILGETVSARFLAAMATAVGGVLLVTGFIRGSAGLAGSASGALLIMAGVLCCATYTVVSRRLVFRLDPLYAVTLQETVALIWVMTIWPLESRSGSILGLAALPPRSIMGGALAGLMYYAGATWLYLHAPKSVPATTASIFLNLQPIFGVAIAYAFLGERLTTTHWIGAVTIVVSVLALLMWSGSAETRASAPQI